MNSQAFVKAIRRVHLLLGLVHLCIAAPPFPGPWDCGSSGSSGNSFGFPSGFSWTGGFPTGSFTFCPTSLQSVGPSNSSPTASQTVTTGTLAHNHLRLTGGAIAGIAIGCTIGVTFLALAAYLLYRRKRGKASNPIEPFIASSRDIPVTGAEPGTTISSEKNAGPFDGKRRNVTGNQAQTSAAVDEHRRPSTTGEGQGSSTTQSGHFNHPAGQTGLNTSTNQSPIDILQLFEDRAFEPHLLRLISQRMDPAPPVGDPIAAGAGAETTHSYDGLPAYQHDER